VEKSDWAGFPQQQEQFAARFLDTEVHAEEAKGMAGLGWIQIDSDNLIVRQHRQQSQSQVASDPRYDDAWFLITHYLEPGGAGLGDGLAVGGGNAGPCAGVGSGPK
jgi:hypothetical protein